jgi:hypothetical protein
MSDSPTTIGSGPSGSTVSSSSPTALAQEAHSLTEDQSGPTATLSSQHAEAGGQTVSKDDPTANSYSLMVRPPALAASTASSCRTGASNGADGISSPATMEEDIDDDLLDYEPSLARDGMEINVIYLSSTDYSLLEEEDVSQLALGP